MIRLTWNLKFLILWYFLHKPVNFHLHPSFCLSAIKIQTRKYLIFCMFFTVHKRFSPKLMIRSTWNLKFLILWCFLHNPVNFHLHPSFCWSIIRIQTRKYLPSTKIFLIFFTIHKRFSLKLMIRSTWNLKNQIPWYFLHVPVNFYLYWAFGLFVITFQTWRWLMRFFFLAFFHHSQTLFKKTKYQITLGLNNLYFSMFFIYYCQFLSLLIV